MQHYQSTVSIEDGWKNAEIREQVYGTTEDFVVPYERYERDMCGHGVDAYTQRAIYDAKQYHFEEYQNGPIVR